MITFTMTAAAVTCLLVIVINAGTTGAATHWHYGDEVHWPKMCKEGKLQSPIALSEHHAVEKEFAPLIFDNYDAEYPAHLKNNGHSAEIRLLVKDQPNVKGGGLPATFILDHLHFHWQSEHTINHYRFPLELHLVHYANSYESLSEALQHPDSVAVFSVLFDLSPDDDGKFTPLIEVIGNLHDKVNTVAEKIFQMKYYLPRDTAGFYRYNGSLTTPPCTEGIIWTVFTNTLPISKKQVEHFKAMQTEEHKDLPKNYRALMDFHDRKVYLKISPIRGSASRTERMYIKIVFLLSAVFVFLM